MNKWSRRCVLASAVACAVPSAVFGQLRIAAYNLAADLTTGVFLNPNTDGVLEGIGAENVNGIVKQLDIIALEETAGNGTSNPTTDPNTTGSLVQKLNQFYGAGTYAPSPLQGKINAGTITGNGANAIIYNTKTVQLISSVGFGTLGSGSTEIARQEVRYEFRPVGYTSASDFYVYVGHFKALGDGTSQMRRNAEAQMIRANELTLPANSRVIYTGDMNLTQGSAEAAWSTLLAPGQGQAIDPINLGNGSWANASTTDPTTKSAYSDATDGLTSRLDFELNTAPTMDGHGFSIISGSYHLFGNNGSTKYNRAVTDATNTSFPGNPNRTTLLNDIASASDHYPIVADYRLPAFLSASIGTTGAKVISGGSLSISTTVTNAAPVALSAGADTLDYSVAASGALTGSTSITGQAALTTGTTTLVVTGTTPGVGTVAVNSTSQEVGGSPVSQAVANVLAHAHPSFTPASQTGSMTINFGTRANNSAALGLGSPSASFAINNLVDAAGATFSSRLNLDSVAGAGSTSILTSNLGSFSNLAAGSGNNFTASLGTGTYGAFTATYTLNLSDENLPGAQPTAPLTLTLVGRIAMAGDSNLDGVVNALDFNALAANFGQTGVNWTGGDFNGDGTVSTIDFTALAQDFGNSYNPNPAPSLGTIVPEPSLLMSFAALATLLPRWRRYASK